MKSCKQRSELCKLPNVESVKPNEIQVAFAQAKATFPLAPVQPNSLFMTGPETT